MSIYYQRPHYMAVLLLTMFMSSRALAGMSHDIWDNLLGKHISPLRGGQATQLDYSGVASERPQLNRYLEQLSAVTRSEFDSWGKAAQLSFLINAYNAWTVELILTAYPKLKSIKDLGSLLQSPWKKSFIPLLGKQRSLDDIEHKLIRGSGRYNDPRIHFAVNCASIGCPALRSEAYSSDKLEAQLESATKVFLSDRTRNRLEGNALKVSKLFKWYRSDFKQGWRDSSKSVAGFLALYKEALQLDEDSTRRLLAGEIDIDYLAYDWRLNSK